MSLDREQIEPILNTLQPWLSNENITGLTVGMKAVDGQETDQLAVVVHVVEKKAGSDLGAADNPIPPLVELHVTEAATGLPRIEMVPTDVVEVGVLRACVLDQKVRPTPGGYQVSVSAGWFAEATGTLGVNITWGGRFRMLTNNHVIANNGNSGSTVYQPDWALWGNGLSTVAGCVPVVTYANRAQPNPVVNTTDFAWCDIAAADGDPAIHQIGVPAGIRAPAVHDPVRWIGKQTAVVQQATVASTAGRFVIEFEPGRWAWFKDCITFNGGMVAQGDSGSAVVATGDTRVVGLIFANDAQQHAYAVRIP